MCLPPASLNQSIKLKVECQETDEIIERLFLNSYGGMYSGAFAKNSLIYASRVKLIEKIGEGKNTAQVYNSVNFYDTGEFGIVYRALLAHESDFNRVPQAVAVKTLKSYFLK